MFCALHVSTGYAPGPRIYVAFLASSSLVAIGQISYFDISYFIYLTMPWPAQWLWGVRNSPGRWEGHCQPTVLWEEIVLG